MEYCCGHCFCCSMPQKRKCWASVRTTSRPSRFRQSVEGEGSNTAPTSRGKAWSTRNRATSSIRGGRRFQHCSNIPGQGLVDKEQGYILIAPTSSKIAFHSATVIFPSITPSPLSRDATMNEDRLVDKITDRIPSHLASPQGFAGLAQEGSKATNSKSLPAHLGNAIFPHQSHNHQARSPCQATGTIMWLRPFVALSTT